MNNIFQKILSKPYHSHSDGYRKLVHRVAWFQYDENGHNTYFAENIVKKAIQSVYSLQDGYNKLVLRLSSLFQYDKASKTIYSLLDEYKKLVRAIAWFRYDETGYSIYFAEKIINFAAGKGYIHQLKYFISRGWELDNNVFSSALSSKNLECVKFVFGKLSDEQLAIMKKLYIVQNAFISKNIDIVNWALDSDFLLVNSNSLENAVWFGDVNLLERLLAILVRNSCGRDKNSFLGNICREVVLYTTKTQNYNVIEWALSSGLKLYDSDHSSSCCGIAIKNNDLKLIEYLFANGFDLGWICYNAACESGNIEIFEWLGQHQANFDENCYQWAAQNNQLDFLKKIFEIRNISINTKTEIFETAVFNGHINIVKWLKNDVVPHKDMMIITNKNLDTLKFLHNLGCPLNEKLLDKEYGYDEFEYAGYIKWLLESKYDFSNHHINRVVTRGNSKVLELLYNTGKLILGSSIVNLIVDDRNIDKMEWLRTHGIKFNMDHYIPAIKACDILVVKWLHKVNCDYDDTIFKYAIESKNYEIAKFVFSEHYTLDIEVLKKLNVSTDCIRIKEYWMKWGFVNR